MKTSKEENEITSANCLHCGRKITDPQSIKLQIGPECRKKFWKSKTIRKVGLIFGEHEMDITDIELQMENVDILIELNEGGGKIYIKAPKFALMVSNKIEQEGKIPDNEIISINEIICFARSTTEEWPEGQVSPKHWDSIHIPKKWRKVKRDKWKIEPTYLAWKPRNGTWSSGHFVDMLSAQDFLDWKKLEGKTHIALSFNFEKKDMVQEPVVQDMEGLEITEAECFANILSDGRFDDIGDVDYINNHEINEGFIQSEQEWFGEMCYSEIGFDPFRGTVRWYGQHWGKGTPINDIPSYIMRAWFTQQCIDVEYQWCPWDADCDGESYKNFIAHICAMKYENEYSSRIIEAIKLITDIRPDEIKIPNPRTKIKKKFCWYWD
jgi:hypothetical protein